MVRSTETKAVKIHQKRDEREVKNITAVISWGKTELWGKKG